MIRPMSIFVKYPSNRYGQTQKLFSQLFSFQPKLIHLYQYFSLHFCPRHSFSIIMAHMFPSLVAASTCIRSTLQYIAQPMRDHHLQRVYSVLPTLNACVIWSVSEGHLCKRCPQAFIWRFRFSFHSRTEAFGSQLSVRT